MVVRARGKGVKRGARAAAGHSIASLVDPMLVLTNDTFTYSVPDAVASRCDTLRDALEMVGDAEAIPLPNVSSTNMARVVKYYSKLAEMEQAGMTRASQEAWKSNYFAAMARPELYLLMETSQYLGAEDLLDAACTHVANLIRGCSSERIREILMVPADMTAEETAAVEEELAWALK